jgi:hypothetical protein
MRILIEPEDQRTLNEIYEVKNIDPSNQAIFLALEGGDRIPVPRKYDNVSFATAFKEIADLLEGQEILIQTTSNCKIPKNFVHHYEIGRRSLADRLEKNYGMEIKTQIMCVPRFFEVIDQEYTKERGTHAFLKFHGKTLTTWLKNFHIGQVIKTASYEYFRQDTFTWCLFNTGSNTPGIYLKLEKEHLIVGNNKAADNEFGPDQLQRKGMLHKYLTILNASLFLIQAVQNNSFEQTQKALIDGALPDIPFFQDNFKSLLHFCYAENLGQNSREIAKEMMYWGANTKGLHDLLSDGTFRVIGCSPAQENAKNDIEQVQDVIKTVNEVIIKERAIDLYDNSLPIYYLMEAYAASGTIFTPPPHKTFAQGLYSGQDVYISGPHPYNGETMGWYSFEWQLLMLKAIVYPENAKEQVTKDPVAKTSHLYGLATFLLDPIKCNIYLHGCFSSEKSRKFSIEGVWTEKGIVSDPDRFCFKAIQQWNNCAWFFESKESLTKRAAKIIANLHYQYETPKEQAEKIYLIVKNMEKYQPELAKELCNLVKNSYSHLNSYLQKLDNACTSYYLLYQAGGLVPEVRKNIGLFFKVLEMENKNKPAETCQYQLG